MEGKLKLEPAAIAAGIPMGVCVVVYTRRMRAELLHEIGRLRSGPNEPVRLDDAWVTRWTRYAVFSGSGSLVAGVVLLTLVGGFEPPPIEKLPLVVGMTLVLALVAGLSFGAMQQRHMREMEAEVGAATFGPLGPHA